MNKWLKWTIVVALFGLLILIRLFESQLFYDPLLNFFKQDYLYGKTPDVEVGKLMLHTAFRFLLNTGISLTILYVVFQEKGIVKFSVFVYTLVFLILFPWLTWLVLNASPESNYNVLFYVRRFLIQPIILLLLLPAFYYHKQKHS
jgi:exosortase F-associated protein